jgi:flavin-dependent dehydrogenase
MSQLGYRVCILERSESPPARFGESLPPSILPILDLFGVRHAVEGSGFLRPVRHEVLWYSRNATLREQPGPPGFLVERGRFNSILLQAARETDVEILRPAVLRRAVRVYDGWSLEIIQDGMARSIFAQFLVDAAGRHGRMARNTLRYAPATCALYGYWRDDQSECRAPQAEAGENAWYWGAPLPDGSFTAIVFLPPKVCAGLGSEQREAKYRALLRESRLLNHCLQGTLSARVQICDASCTFDQDPISRDNIKIGDASFTLDPLSSQGVQAAMVSAFQGAIVVNTILSRLGDAALAIEFYRNRQKETVARHRRLAGNFLEAGRSAHGGMSSAGRFQTKNLAPSDFSPSSGASVLRENPRLRLSAALELELVPSIEGNFVSQHLALRHPALEHPVAFLGGVAIAPLLEVLQRKVSVAQILYRWSQTVPLAKCWQILEWLYQREMIVECEHCDSVLRYSP